MQYLKYAFLCFVFLALAQPYASAHIPEKDKKAAKVKRDRVAQLRSDCTSALEQTDQDVNNVRARLTTGGDVWWDGSDGLYIVPKVDPASGVAPVSSLFAGAVWLGGVDRGNNLKVACQTYGRSSGASDFWPGPLTPNSGETNAQRCQEWDQFFKVTGTEIDQHIALFNEFPEGEYPEELIPDGVKYWPAKGNPFFEDRYGFELPFNDQGLGNFWDVDGDTNYDPTTGDYPIIDIAGCDEPQYPDDMVYWVYNDNGNIHAETQGDAIRMEVQVQAFAFSTNDEINNMTFQRYKLINRAREAIDSTFFAMWVDPDLGCYQDDYIGCDTALSMAYVYNEDAQDGIEGAGCACENVNTYCTTIPILGVDYFRGPRDEFGDELGMSSFTYYNNGAVGTPPPGTDDPEVASEYYNYITGSWRDGTSFSFGGNGYNAAAPASAQIDYAFTDDPDDDNGWSMCTQDLPFGDRRTIQASGPFTLLPGAVNELIIGVVWVPDEQYPCPSLDRLRAADFLAQGLFDNCFDILDGPDAPTVDWIELDQEIIAVVSNNDESTLNNNANENYEEVDIFAPDFIPLEDRIYKFEGYRLYQLAGPGVGLSEDEINDPTKVRLVQTVDLKNGIRELYNWEAVPHPNQNDPNTNGWSEVYVPVIKVEASQATDEGISRTFRITEDLFATDDRTLVNHKKYYFSIVAYAHNEYEPFYQDNSGVPTGQRTTYLEGRRGPPEADGRQNPVYVVEPRPSTYEVYNAVYGQGTQITRLEGKGTGDRFLDMTTETRNSIIDGSFDGRIVYEEGQGPFIVQVYNPREIKNGRFRLDIVDKDLQDSEVAFDATWRLTDLNDNTVIESDKDITSLSEQVLAQYGFSVGVVNTTEPYAPQNTAAKLQEDNGAEGSEYVFGDAEQWIGFIPDMGGLGFQGRTNFVRTGTDDTNFSFDPDSRMASVDDGRWVPYLLTSPVNFDEGPWVSPSWTGEWNQVTRRGALEDINNVDIVLTPDKSRWSRCVIVETSNDLYYDNPQGTDFESVGDAENLQLRQEPSVGKDDSNGDGLPDPDGETDQNGDPRIGMGWFPGYAVDVETGARLNIFFGENSSFSAKNLEDFNVAEFLAQEPISGKYFGEDMMFNPTPDVEYFINNSGDADQLVYGGLHFIYVTDSEYDGCEAIYNDLIRDRTSSYINVYKEVTWSSIPIRSRAVEWRSYADGLIPSEAIFKLRVDNPFGTSEGAQDSDDDIHPSYEFEFSGVEREDITAGPLVDPALDEINVVPNPYYGFSDYETSQFTTRVKITNLPAECTVTIYTLDGKFIRQYNRNEEGIDIFAQRDNGGIRTSQVVPNLEWDIKNNKGIPVASGVYLIHVDAPGLGERVIKWFGVQRQYDPSGL